MTPTLTKRSQTGRRKRRWAPLVCLLATICLATGAHADPALEDFLEMSLDELASFPVVTSTKTELSLEDAPGTISVITREQIENSPATSIPELLRNVPGVNVRWNPMVQTIDMRSFGSNPFTSRVLLLIDGVPYNSWNKGGFPQHPGFDFFNLDIVEHIEVMRGSGSSLYGENAFNGVINIITTDEAGENRTRLRYARGSLNLETLSGSISRSLGDGKNILGALRYTRGQIPTELWTEEANGDATGYDLFLKTQLSRFNLSYYRRDDSFKGYEHELSGGFPPGTFFRSAPKINQEVNIIGAGYEQALATIDSQLTAKVSYANRDGSHCAACHARNEGPSFSDSENHGYQLFANAQLDSQLSPNHKLTTGVEWRKISSGDHSVELHGGAASAPGHASETVQRYKKHALFVQDQWTPLDSRLLITSGVRYESATSPGLFSDQWFPRINVVFRPNERLRVKAGWHRAARYPSFSELYQNSAFVVAETPTFDIPLANFVPNLELAPEFVKSSEFGVDYRISAKARTSLTLFNNRIRNAIIIAYPRIRFENHPADARVRGLEFAIQSRPLQWLSADFNWSLQNNAQRGDGVDSGGNPLEFSYAPKHKLNLMVSATPTPHLSASLDVNWTDGRFAPSFWYPIAFGDPEPFELDAFAYVNLKLTYKPRWLIRDGKRPLMLSGAVRNITNERPYETLTGFGGRNTGRTAYFSIEYRWGSE